MTEWMRVVSRLSSKLIGGRIDGNAFGQHRLARPRRSDHQHVVAAGHGDFDGALGVKLAAHVAEVFAARWLPVGGLIGST